MDRNTVLTSQPVPAMATMDAIAGNTLSTTVARPR